MFHRQITTEPHWGIQFTATTSRVQALPEYKEVGRAIQSHPELARQMDTLVGSPMAASRMTVDRVVSHLSTTILRTRASGFDRAAFDSAYEHVEGALASDSVAYRTVAPLTGFSCPEATIQLSRDLAIRKMSDPEIVRAIELGLLHSVFGPGHPVDAPDFAIEFTQSLPKRVGDHNESAERAANWQEEPYAGIAHVLSTLRIFMEGRIDIAGTIASTSGWLASGTAFRSGDVRPPYIHAYVLTADDVAGLIAFYKACDSRAVRQSKGLDMAIRRFGYSSERRRADDQIVDLMIAAEALYLQGRDDPARGEQRYRLSLRGAMLTPTDEWDRRQLFALYRNAYDARSIVAHGGTVDKAKLPDGREVTLPEFCLVVTQQLRKAIKQAIEMCARKNRTFQADWENALLTGAPLDFVSDPPPT